MSRSFTDDNYDGGVWVRKKFLSKDSDRPKKNNMAGPETSICYINTYCVHIIHQFLCLVLYLSWENWMSRQEEFPLRQILE